MFFRRLIGRLTRSLSISTKPLHCQAPCKWNKLGHTIHVPRETVAGRCSMTQHHEDDKRIKQNIQNQSDDRQGARPCCLPEGQPHRQQRER